MTLKGKILKISEDIVFFNFVNKMIDNGKKTGKIKFKDGSVERFKYLTTDIIENKKIHYIIVE